jgi:HK97 family phage major capsid protein
MEFKSITEAIDQIAILQKKASEFNESEELKKDMSESLRALETFIISQKTSEPVVQDKKSGVTLSASEFVDFLILKAIDERDSVMRNRQKYSEKDLLGLVIKDKAKFKTLSDTTTMGDWIPTEFQDQVIDLIIDNIAAIVDFIQNIFRWSSGSNTRRYPYIDWYANFYGVEGTTITESNTSDLYFDISAKPFKGMYKWTDEVDMFTIPEMLPILRNALFFGLSISIEDSMINGDTTYTSPNVRRYLEDLLLMLITQQIYQHLILLILGLLDRN